MEKLHSNHENEHNSIESLEQNETDFPPFRGPKETASDSPTTSQEAPSLGSLRQKIQGLFKRKKSESINSDARNESSRAVPEPDKPGLSFSPDDLGEEAPIRPKEPTADPETPTPADPIESTLDSDAQESPESMESYDAKTIIENAIERASNIGLEIALKTYDKSYFDLTEEEKAEDDRLRDQEVAQRDIMEKTIKGLPLDDLLQLEEWLHGQNNELSKEAVKLGVREGYYNDPKERPDKFLLNQKLSNVESARYIIRWEAMQHKVPKSASMEELKALQNTVQEQVTELGEDRKSKEMLQEIDDRIFEKTVEEASFEELEQMYNEFIKDVRNLTHNAPPRVSNRMNKISNRLHHEFGVPNARD